MEAAEKQFSRTKKELEEGFTLRSALIILYCGIAIQPVVIWLTLTSGVSILTAVPFFMALTFAEIASIYGKPLKKQELVVVVTASSVASGMSLFLTLMFNLFLANSAITYSFGISSLLPDWYAPGRGSEVLITRSFLDPSWVKPIFYFSLFGLLTLIGNISISLFLRQLFVKGERLPFPLAEVSAEACVTLAERNLQKMLVFSVCAVFSLGYGIILYGIPILSWALGAPLTTIPLPWFDFNSILERYAPGSSFGIATDLLVFTVGFMVPFNVAASMLAGSIALYIVGNPLMIQLGIWKGWLPGMSVADNFLWSTLRVWASPSIGIAIAVALLPLIRLAPQTIRVFSSLRKVTFEREPGDISPLIYLGGFFGSTITASVLLHILIPGFPFWMIILFTVVFSFLLALYHARARGLTGVTLAVPYLRQALILASGYKGVDAWVWPLGMPDADGGTMVEALKVAELTETKTTSYIKAYATAYIIGFVMNFIFVSIFWSMASIPSQIYPATQIFWPVQVSQAMLWMSRSLDIFKPEWIVGSFSVMALIYAVIEVLHLPISLMGLAAGSATAIPVTVSLFIGAIIAKLLSRIEEGNWWRANRALIVAGIGAGEGLIVILSVCGSIVIRSLWNSPL